MKHTRVSGEHVRSPWRESGGTSWLRIEQRTAGGALHPSLARQSRRDPRNPGQLRNRKCHATGDREADVALGGLQGRRQGGLRTPEPAAPVAPRTESRRGHVRAGPSRLVDHDWDYANRPSVGRTFPRNVHFANRTPPELKWSRISKGQIGRTGNTSREVPELVKGALNELPRLLVVTRFMCYRLAPVLFAESTPAGVRIDRSGKESSCNLKERFWGNPLPM